VRQRISSGSVWEPEFGYSRALRVGNAVFVSGTTAGFDEAGRVCGGNDLYRQAHAALEKIGKALSEAGASFDDVVRTRTYVTSIANFAEVSRAHREVFGDVLPAATLVEVSALVDPVLLVEIEADAIIGSIPSPEAGR